VKLKGGSSERKGMQMVGQVPLHLLPGELPCSAEIREGRSCGVDCCASGKKSSRRQVLKRVFIDLCTREH
jgi:hypothetical protein